MKRTGTAVVIMVFCGLLAANAFAQAVYYVQSAKAKVMSGPSFKSALVTEVTRGAKLVSVGKEGNWAKVKVNEKEGYISLLLLSSRPPMDKVGVIKGDDVEIKQGVRRRASSYTSAAAARGLAQDDRRRLSREEKSDYESLEKMESYTVSPEELNKFAEGMK